MSVAVDLQTTLDAQSLSQFIIRFDTPSFKGRIITLTAVKKNLNFSAVRHVVL
jgi:hypothetical protein